jgi:hypothetical protein
MCAVTLDALRDVFADWPKVWPGYIALSPPTDAQLELLVPVVELHQDEGVLRGDLTWTSPRDSCPDGPLCWAGCPTSSYEHHGGAPLPYVGPAYRAGGVAVVGINTNDATDPLVEYDITERDIAAFRAGRTAGASSRSKFAYYTARSAHALITARTGGTVTDEENPAALVDAVLATARFQSVKCSPLNEMRSQPTAPMATNCPPRFLQRELDLLKPRVLLAFGQPVRWALARIGAEISDERADLGVGTLARDWGTVEVYCLHHPAAHAPHNWHASQEQLINRLARP